MRSALSVHAERGSVAVLDAKDFDTPSTKSAAQALAKWGAKNPILLLLTGEEIGAMKSFRNLPRTHVLEVGAAGVADVIGAAAVVISETALETLKERLMDARTILIRPVISEKSYALIAEGKYTFRVNDRAHKTQIAQAVEEVFGVNVAQVRTAKVNSKPKRRGLTKGRTRAWKKAIVQLAPGERIELFEGAETA
jgi:large subunit ribosomal protein L23